MSATARIMAYLGMNPADFNKGVDQAHSKVKGFEGALSGMKGKLIAAFSVGAVVAGIKNIANASGAIVDYADNLRVSTDELQALTIAAKEYGLTQEDIVGILQKVMRAQEDAASATPTKTISDAMRQLGFTLDELDSMNPAQIFEKIAKGAQSGSEGMAAAFAILGRGGPRNRSFMEGLASFGLDAAIAEAADSGRLIAEAALKSTDDALDKKITPFWDTVKSKLASGIGWAANYIPGGKMNLKGSFTTADKGFDNSIINEAARQRSLDEKADAIALETDEKRRDFEFDSLSIAEKRLRLEQDIAWTKELMARNPDKYTSALYGRDILDYEMKLAGLKDEKTPQVQADQFRRIGANVFGGTTIDSTAKKSLTVQEKMLVEMRLVRAAAEKAKQGVF